MNQRRLMKIRSLIFIILLIGSTLVYGEAIDRHQEEADALLFEQAIKEGEEAYSTAGETAL